MAVNLNDDFEEETVTLRDKTYFLGIVYQYLIEGLVPLLSVFAKQYTELWHVYKDVLTQPPLSKEDAEILKVFRQELEVIISAGMAISIIPAFFFCRW